MKTTRYFCLFYLLSFGLQAQDTLFSKNFNNLELYTSNDPRASVYSQPLAFLRVVSSPNSTALADGSPAMVADIGFLIGQEIFGPSPMPNGPSVPFYRVQLTSSPVQDTVYVTYDLRARAEAFSQENSLPLSMMQTFYPMFLYTNTVTQNSFSKRYDIRCLFPVELELEPYTPYVSIKKDPNVPDLKKVSMKYVKDQIPFQNFSLRVVSPFMSRMFEVFFPAGSKAISEADLKPTLLADFCATTDNPSDCQTKAFYHLQAPVYGEVDYARNVLVDNIAILGKNRKVITDLEEGELLSNEQEILHAYTLIGTEIEDYAHYTGLAIVERRDGSRKKIHKQ